MDSIFHVQITKNLKSGFFKIEQFVRPGRKGEPEELLGTFHAWKEEPQIEKTNDFFMITPNNGSSIFCDSYEIFERDQNDQRIIIETDSIK
jgi:hypothetical protein